MSNVVRKISDVRLFSKEYGWVYAGQPHLQAGRVQIYTIVWQLYAGGAQNEKFHPGSVQTLVGPNFHLVCE